MLIKAQRFLLSQKSTNSVNASVQKFSSPKSIAACIAIGVVGTLSFSMMPLLIGVYTEHLQISKEQVGLLGTADMAGMMCATLFAAAYWIRRWNWRQMALVCHLILLAGHLLTTQVSEIEWLLLMRFIAGFGGGSLIAISAACIGDTKDPDRWFGAFICAQMGTGAILLWVMTRTSAEFGLSGLFGGLALIVLVSMFSLRLIPLHGVKSRKQTRHRKARFSLFGFLTLAGIFIYYVGTFSIWSYAERIGNSAGLSLSDVGNALSMGLFASMTGALSAAIMGSRFGRVIPLTIAIGGLLTSFALLGSNAGFMAGILLFSFCWNYGAAYLPALIAAIDNTGSLIVWQIMMTKLGVTVAPFIASLLFQSTDLLPLLFVASACSLAAFALYLPVARRYSGNN